MLFSLFVDTNGRLKYRWNTLGWLSTGFFMLVDQFGFLRESRLGCSLAERRAVFWSFLFSHCNTRHPWSMLFIND